MAKFVPKKQKTGAKFVPKSEMETETYIPEELQTKEVEGTLGERLGSTARAGAYMAETAGRQAVGGLAGLGRLAYGVATGEKDPLSRSVETIESITDASTFAPETERGRTILQNLVDSPRIKALVEQSKQAGEATRKATGSPAAATAVETAIQSLPDILGAESRFTAVKPRGAGPEGSELAPSQKERAEVEIKETPTTRAVRKQDIKRFNKILDKEGIEVGSGKDLIESLKEIGENIQKGGEQFTDSIQAVQQAVRQKRQIEKEVENDFWERARQGGEAYVQKQDVVEFTDQLKAALEPYRPTIEEFSKGKKLLKEVEEIKNLPDNSSVKLSAIQNWRKKINANMPSDKTSPEAATLITMKSNLDNFIENKFATDMLKGDSESVARWRAAIDKTSEIKNTFDSDSIIRKFAKHEASPEELRKYIFNSTAVGAKDTAKKTVSQLKKILGEDSKEMTALRQESMFNLVEPLVKEEPNFSKFKENYEKFVKKNKGIIEELFPENSRESLDVLYRASKSAEPRQRIQSAPQVNSLSDILAVTIFGHDIAQGGLKVRLAKSAVNNMLSREKPIKKEIMQDFLEYDPRTPAFKAPARRAAAIAGGTEAAKQQQEETE